MKTKNESASMKTDIYREMAEELGVTRREAKRHCWLHMYSQPFNAEKLLGMNANNNNNNAKRKTT